MDSTGRDEFPNIQQEEPENVPCCDSSLFMWIKYISEQFCFFITLDKIEQHYLVFTDIINVFRSSKSFSHTYLIMYCENL